MDRLTAWKRISKTPYYPYCFTPDGCGGTGPSEKCGGCEFEGEICYRLAAYEDTGLTPEEIVEVQDFANSSAARLLMENQMLKAQLRFIRSKDKFALPGGYFELICKYVHNSWWEEKARQGITDHPDMIPYSELPEEKREYDRVTVRRVLDFLGITYREIPGGGL